MSDDLISRQALLRDIEDGLENFPPFVDESEKVEWILRWIEGAPAGQENHVAAGTVENGG